MFSKDKLFYSFLVQSKLHWSVAKVECISEKVTKNLKSENIVNFKVTDVMKGADITTHNHLRS